MSPISLRDYLKEIESLIETNQFDDAISHSLFILGKYPKYVTAYRNLGKALLESKRYEEASDIFSKVLTVFPDDFISHIGLSVINENDRDLDASIWHMEQAFDSQPSNVVVQEELRRLIGRRDGITPGRIRLTRGALTRMYAKGELYQQAISEIHAALNNGEKKVDLQVLLAKMYFLTGKQKDAQEICRSIIETLPYCYEANRILFEISESSNPSENEELTYKTRLIELDPYNQFISKDHPSNDFIPDDTIIFEKLENITSVTKDASIPAWARSIGLTSLEESTTALEPAIVLDDGSKDSYDAAPFLMDEVLDSSSSEIGSPAEEQLPDWISNSGWTRESLTASEEQGSPESEIDNSLLIQPADDIPDWIGSLNPEKSDDLLDSSSDNPDSELSKEGFIESLTNWAEDVKQENSPIERHIPSIDGNLDLFDQPNENTQENLDLPDWLKNYETNSTDSTMEPPQSSENIFITSIEEEAIFDTPSKPFDEFANEDLESPINQIDPSIFQEEDRSEELSFIDEKPENIEMPIVESDHSEDPNKLSESIPSWVKSILGNSITTSETENPVISPSIENEISPELPPEEDFIPSLISDLSNNSVSVGLLSEETNQELLSWLQEVTPEDQLPYPSSDQVSGMNTESSLSETIENEMVKDLFDERVEDSENTDNQPIIDTGDSPELDTRLSDLFLETGALSSIEVDESQVAPPSIEFSQETDNFLINIIDSTQDLSTGEDEAEILISDVYKLAEDLPIEISSSEIFPEQPIDTLENDSLELVTDSFIDQSQELEKSPSTFEDWQKLGLEYLSTSHFSEALEAFSHAERMLINSHKE